MQYFSMSLEGFSLASLAKNVIEIVIVIKKFIALNLNIYYNHL
jgi:hypothetical protein